MNTHARIGTAALCCWAVASSLAWPAGDDWLNARDFGASGSDFETVASTTAGSNQIVVKDVGDLEVGQGVLVSKCHVHYGRTAIRGPAQKDMAHTLEGRLGVRGFDGSAGDWLVFVLDVDGADPFTFRWSDDRGRTWQGTRVPVTYDWQTLSGGVEVRFRKGQWKLGQIAHFSARTQLVSTIEAIDGNRIRLAHAANRSVEDAVVKHCDHAALQRAIDAGVKQRRHVLVPVGRYRLATGVVVRNAAIRIEGANAGHTVLDISDGEGPIFRLLGGEEVTIRNFRMVGHTGLAEKPGAFRTASGYRFWCCSLKPCKAAQIRATERVLFENVHVARMASEAFYCHGPDRYKRRSEKRAYTKSLTYLRCSVTDCAANAFNNNDTAENTSVLYCRIDGAGWYAWEGPARFIRLIGNYVRNSGGFAVGHMSHRIEHLNELGCGQAVVKDNVFEGCDGRNGSIAVHVGSTQVSIANNLFVNYNGTAVSVSSRTRYAAYPSEKVVVSGNIIDLTHVGQAPRPRTGVFVDASDVTVADNQIYVRGQADPRVTGIDVREPAINVTVHDNLVRNCAYGLRTGRVRSAVAQVIDNRTFQDRSLPPEWRASHLYRGWRLVWLKGGQPDAAQTIEAFDPGACTFALREPRAMKVGDAFEVYPDSANWLIHSNTITGCKRPVVLEAYGGSTTLLRDNVITRGGAAGVTWAVVVESRCKLIGNLIAGFDEDNASALVLRPDRVGRSRPNVYRDNIIDGCYRAVLARKAGLWESAITAGNVFTGCRSAPKQAQGQPAQAVPVAVEVQPEPVRAAVLTAPKRIGPAVVDGDVSEWPWTDRRRVALIRQAPDGGELLEAHGRMCAARDAAALYLAVRVARAKGTKLQAGLGWAGDGMELSLRGMDAKTATPIFVFWGTVDGRFNGSTAMGASAKQMAQLEEATTYAARVSDDEWTCEWRLPFAAMGLTRARPKRFKLNVGLLNKASSSWAAWVGTGGRICEVDLAGEVQLDE